MAHVCKSSGQLATEEASELTSNKDLALIPRNLTEINSISVNFENNLIHINYRIDSNFTIEETEENLSLDQDYEALKLRNLNIFLVAVFCIILLSALSISSAIILLKYNIFQKNRTLSQTKPIEIELVES